jgi:hypothetical protein
VKSERGANKACVRVVVCVSSNLRLFIVCFSDPPWSTLHGRQTGNLFHGFRLLCNNVNDTLVWRLYKPDVLECIPVVYMFDVDISDTYL